MTTQTQPQDPNKKWVIGWRKDYDSPKQYVVEYFRSDVVKENTITINIKLGERKFAKPFDTWEEVNAFFKTMPRFYDSEYFFAEVPVSELVETTENPF